MAVVIYKGGRVARIEPHTLQNHLNAGWSVTKDAPKPTVEEIDTNGSGKLSSEEVRTAAKEAGIEDWEKKRIKTLLKELGHGDKED